MTDAPPSSKPSRRPWAILRVVGLIFLIPLIFAAVAAVMLVDRDIDAPAWVKSRIEARASALLQGGEMRFGQIFVNVGKDLHPRVRLVDMQVFDASGAPIARVPSVEGLMSPRGILFQGDVLMQDIQVQGAMINLSRAVDGTVALDFGGGGFGQAPSFVALLDQSDQVLEQPALAALETIAASGVIINYTDARAGRSWTVDGGQLDLDLRGDKTQLFGDFALLTGGADITRLQLNYQSPRGSREADVGLSLTNARASDIATQTPALAWLADVDAAITASLRSSLDADGTLGPLSATLDLGAGALQPNATTDPMRFDRAKAYLTYDPQAASLRFDQVEIAAPAGHLRASGQAFLQELRDGIPQALVAQFAFTDVNLAQSDLYPDGLALPPSSVDMRLRFDPFSIEIGQIALIDGPSHITARGDIAATPDGWTLALDAQADTMTTDRFTALWPRGVKVGSRTWLAENVSGGVIENAAVALRIQQGSKPSIAASYDFSQAKIKFMRTMPPITGAAGAGYMHDHQMFVTLDSGGVTAPQGGRADLTGSVLTVLDTRVKGGDARLDLAMKSTLTAALSVLDQEPFRFVSKANQSVTMADGRAEISGSIQFPLRKGTSPDQIAFDISADLRGLSSETLIKGRSLRANRMRLSASNGGLRVSGPVVLDGVAANVAWVKAFGPANAGKSRIEADVGLSQDALSAFNIVLPDGMVSGAGRGTIAIDLVKDRAPAFTLTSDLQGIGLSLPSVGWRKRQSTSGDLRITGNLGPVPEVTSLVVSGGGLRAEGRVTMNADGGLDQARFSRVRLGDWLDAPVTLRGRGKGRPVGVTLGQGRVDLRGAAFGGGASGGGGPLALRLDRLQITKGIALHDFIGDFTGAGGFSGEFSGKVNGGPRISGTVVPVNGRSSVRLLSDNAGGAISAAGFVKNGSGGALDLMLQPTQGAGTFDGTLKIRDLRVQDAPSIAALLDAISVVGLLRQLDGQGLAFDEIDASFRLTPTQVIVTQSSAIGPGLGISLDGVYTLTNKTVDFQGVVSPFYLLNGIASFLTRKGEGLIGFNFNLTGDIGAPSVFVNPLSALTPGMFREIFRRPPPQVTQ